MTSTRGPDWEERYRGDEMIVSELLPAFAGTVVENRIGSWSYPPHSCFSKSSCTQFSGLR
jgi:hypothetical protein